MYLPCLCSSMSLPKDPSPLGVDLFQCGLTHGPQSLQGCTCCVVDLPMATDTSRCTFSHVDLPLGHSPFRGIPAVAWTYTQQQMVLLIPTATDTLGCPASTRTYPQVKSFLLKLTLELQPVQHSSTGTAVMPWPLAISQSMHLGTAVIKVLPGTAG